VWLLQALFRKRAGGFHLDVNPGLGRLTATFDPARFDLSGYLSDLAQVGYRTGPPVRSGHAASDGLGLRLGITFAIAMNAMALSAAHYFGLEPGDEANLYVLFGWLNLALSTAAFCIGAPVFIRGAYQALKRRAFHLDLPIALGLVLAFGGSVGLFLSGSPERAYFDTLDIFIALMLLGRWAQRRFLERNRRLLLEDDGFASTKIRILGPDQRVSLEPLSRLAPGTRFLLAPGELVPVAATLADTHGPADFSLAWVTGESDPITHTAAQPIPAGAHLLGEGARVAESREAFATSSLHDLLRRPPETPTSTTDDDRRPDAFWHRVTTVYVLVVLAAAFTAALAWYARDPSRVLDVTTAILVVTCPCAIGLATPLAYELASNRLRRRGLHTRRPGLLDRARHLRTVVFDKTGTLTLGDLALDDLAPLDALTADERLALSQMVLRSNHPKSRALAEALPPAVLDPAADIREVPGRGLTFRIGPRELRLEASTDGRAVVFLEHIISNIESLEDQVIRRFESLEDRVIATFTFREVLRADARAEVARLLALGLEVHLASGDAPDRALAVARDLRIPETRVHARMSPEDKASLLARLEATHPGSTLMLGDGINDALAFSAATLAGTPAIDRPTLPARADFFLTTRGLGPLSDLIRESRLVRAITVRNLALALAYNGLGLFAALMGWLSPVVCALAMPASSLLTLALTIGASRPRACPLPPAAEVTA
jgi:Cu2+-exporting ATPase